MSAIPSSITNPTTLSKVVAAPDFVKMSEDQDAAMAQHNKAADAERAPLVDAVSHQAKEVDRLVAEPLEKQPLPENKAMRMNPEELTDAASTYMTLGALAGLLTRQPMTSALTNMTAAMQGVKEGDETRFKQSYDQYTKDFQKAMAANKAMLDEREKVIKDNNLSLTAKEAQLKLIDLKNGAKAQELQRSFKDRVDAHYKQGSLAQRAEEANARLAAQVAQWQEQNDIKRDAAAAKAAANTGTGTYSTKYTTDPKYKKQVDFWAGVIHSGGSLPPRFAHSGAGKEMFGDIVQVVPTLGAGNPNALLANQSEFGGDKAGARAVGTRAANFGLAKSEAYEMADLVTQASADAARTEFMPLNKALNAFETNTGDVPIRQFGAAVNSFINAYARAVSPIGTPTVSDKEHAREMLSTADSHDQVVGIISQLKKEMEAAGNAPKVVREQQRESILSRGNQPKQISSDAEYNALPSGAEYIAPDGSRRKKK